MTAEYHQLRQCVPPFCNVPSPRFAALKGLNTIAQGKSGRVPRALTPPWVRIPKNIPRPSNPSRQRARITEAETTTGTTNKPPLFP